MFFFFFIPLNPFKSSIYIIPWNKDHSPWRLVFIYILRPKTLFQPNALHVSILKFRDGIWKLYVCSWTKGSKLLHSFQI